MPFSPAGFFLPQWQSPHLWYGPGGNSAYVSLCSAPSSSRTQIASRYASVRVTTTVPLPVAILAPTGGMRSALAAKTAQDMGLRPVAHILGGFGAWREAGGPVDKPAAKT